MSIYLYSSNYIEHQWPTGVRRSQRHMHIKLKKKKAENNWFFKGCSAEEQNKVKVNQLHLEKDEKRIELRPIETNESVQTCDV